MKKRETESVQKMGNRRCEKRPSRACQEGNDRKVDVSGCNQGENNSTKVGGIALLDLLF
jgi:hypothetical protein